MTPQRLLFRAAPVFVILLCSLFTLAPQAQPPDIFDRLSSYVPANSLVFAAVRTDGAALAGVDALLAEVQAVMGLPVDITTGQLMQVMLSGSGRNFDTDIRPWLGSGFGGFSGFGSSGIIFDVRDPELARGFIERYTGSLGSQFTSAASGNFETWTNSASYPYQTLAFGENVLMIVSATNERLLAAPQTGEGTLGRQARYARAVDALPAADYAAVGYADLPAALVPALRARDSASQLLGMALARAVGPMAFGITREGDTLALDAVISRGNVRGIESLGFEFRPVFINPGILSVVPADALGVIHGTELLGFPLQIREFITGRLGQTVFGDIVKEVAGDDDLDAVLDLLTLNTAGITIDDAANWMGGDYAAFVRLRPNPDCLLSSIIYCGIADATRPDFAIVFEPFDPAAAGRTLTDFADNLRLIWSDPYASSSRISEEIVPGGAMWRVQYFDYRLSDYSDLAVFGTNGTHVAFGTGQAVRDALSGAASEPAGWLAAASQQTPPDAGMAWYLNPRGLIASGDLLALTGNALSIEANEALQAALTLLDTAAITLRIDEQGNTILRASLNLTTGSQRPEAAAIATATGEAVRTIRDSVAATATQAGVDQAATQNAAQAIAQTATQAIIQATQDAVGAEQTARAATQVMLQATQDAAQSAVVAENATLAAEFDITQTAAPAVYGQALSEQATGVFASADDTAQIQVNQIYEDRLSPDERDRWVFTGIGGATYQIRLETDFFVQGGLFTNEGRSIPQAVFRGRDTTMTVTLPTTGLYVVSIFRLGADGEGNYRLSVMESHSVPPPTMTPLPTMTPFPTATLVSENFFSDGNLVFGGELSGIFTPQSSGAYVITVSSVEFDTTLSLRDSSGAEIAYNDDGISGTTNSQITVTLNADRPYTYIVRSYNNNGGGEFTVSAVQQ